MTFKSCNGLGGKFLSILKRHTFFFFFLFVKRLLGTEEALCDGLSGLRYHIRDLFQYILVLTVAYHLGKHQDWTFFLHY